jgi:hypothetical protein
LPRNRIALASIMSKPAQFAGRSADNLKHIGGGGLLLQRFLQVAVLACTSLNSRTFSIAMRPGRQGADQLTRAR